MTHECSTPQELIDKANNYPKELTIQQRQEWIVEAKDSDGNVVFQYKKVMRRR